MTRRGTSTSPTGSTTPSARSIPSGAVTTFAGQPTRIPATPVDGTGTAATFNGVFGIAIGPQGNLYVSEINDVRKIAPDGTVTTLAGTLGSPAGDQDGTGSAASFDVPEGIAVDAQGNVYVAEAMGCVIRKITPSGGVTTLAGQAGQRGQADGTGSAARFNDPEALAVGPAGNVWVSDALGIPGITPAGVVTTPYPGVYGQGLAFDGQGHLLYDTVTAVDRLDASGSSTVVAGAGGLGHVDGPAASAEFLFPKGLFLDASGNIFVAGWGSSCVREVSATGTVSTVAGVAPDSGQDVDGTGAAARFTEPTRIAADGQGGAFVLEGDSSGNLPTALRHVDAAGAVTTLFSASHNVASQFLAATPDGTPYVVGKSASFNPEIDTVASDGTLTPFAGGAAGGADGKGTAAGLGTVRSLTADAAGNLWLVDLDLSTFKSRIRKITPDGTVTTVASEAGMGWQHLAVDPSGNVYALSTFSVVSVASDGTAQTVAGQAQDLGNSDGQGAAATFNSPGALVAGPGGDLFVADTDNGLLRRVTPGGTVTTLLGAIGTRKIAPGPLPTTIDSPQDLDFAHDGSLLILDGNALLRLHAH